MKRKPKTQKTPKFPRIDEIESSTADAWLAEGKVKVTSVGCENTYYADKDGKEFYCKNYPR